MQILLLKQQWRRLDQSALRLILHRETLEMEGEQFASNSSLAFSSSLVLSNTPTLVGLSLNNRINVTLYQSAWMFMKELIINVGLAMNVGPWSILLSNVW